MKGLSYLWNLYVYELIFIINLLLSYRKTKLFISFSLECDCHTKLTMYFLARNCIYTKLAGSSYICSVNENGDCIQINFHQRSIFIVQKKENSTRIPHQSQAFRSNVKKNVRFILFPQKSYTNEVSQVHVRVSAT